MKFPNHASIRSTGLLGSLVAVLLLTVGARADLEQPASWSPPGAPDVRAAVIALLDERSVDAQTRAQVEQLWADPPDDAEQEPLLARLAATCALIEPAADELVEFCDHVSEVVTLPEFAILRDPPASHMEAAAPQFLNILRVCDVPDMLGMLAPRPLTIYHRNQKAWEKVAKIYAAAGAADKLKMHVLPSE